MTFDGGSVTAKLAGGTLQFTANSTISTPLTTATAGPAIIDTHFNSQPFTVLDTQPISGAGVLEKVGSGVLNLVSASTYTSNT